MNPVPASTKYGRKMRALYGDAFRAKYNAWRKARRALLSPEARRAKRKHWDYVSKCRRAVA